MTTVVDRLLEEVGMAAESAKSACRACGQSTRAIGDLLCAACWPRVPATMKAEYRDAWNGVRFNGLPESVLEAATARLIASAKSGVHLKAEDEVAGDEELSNPIASDYADHIHEMRSKGVKWPEVVVRLNAMAKTEFTYQAVYSAYRKWCRRNSIPFGPSQRPVGVHPTEWAARKEERETPASPRPQASSTETHTPSSDVDGAGPGASFPPRVALSEALKERLAVIDAERVHIVRLLEIYE